MADVGCTYVHNVPSMDNLGVHDVHIDLDLLATLLPPVELDTSDYLVLVVAAQGPADNVGASRRSVAVDGGAYKRWT